MKKLVEKIEVLDALDIDTSYFGNANDPDIDTLIDYLSEAKSKGATNIKLYTPDCDEITIQPYREDFESDEDFEARKNEEQKRQDAAKLILENIERVEYQRLKRKFEQ